LVEKRDFCSAFAASKRRVTKPWLEREDSKKQTMQSFHGKMIRQAEHKEEQHNDRIKTLSTAARVFTIYTVDNLSYSAFIRKKAFFSECD
jgi:hypothetical protein